MLFDNFKSNRHAKTSTFTHILSSKERLEYFPFYIFSHTNTGVLYTYFKAITILCRRNSNTFFTLKRFCLNCLYTIGNNVHKYLVQFTWITFYFTLRIKLLYDFYIRRNDIFYKHQSTV